MYDKLLKLCQYELEKKPNHSYAQWYKAKAYYQMKEYIKSKKVF